MNNESKQEKGRNKLRDCLQTAQWMWRVKYEWELLWREAKGSPFVVTRRVDDSSREIKRENRVGLAVRLSHLTWTSS